MAVLQSNKAAQNWTSISHKKPINAIVEIILCQNLCQHGIAKNSGLPCFFSEFYKICEAGIKKENVYLKASHCKFSVLSLTLFFFQLYSVLH